MILWEGRTTYRVDQGWHCRGADATYWQPVEEFRHQIDAETYASMLNADIPGHKWRVVPIYS